MIAGSVVALMLAAAAAAFVVMPLLRRDAAEAERRSETLSRARELQSRRGQLLDSLKDLEDDHATGKIDESDYRTLHDRLETEAIGVMRELDGVEAEHAQELEQERESRRPLPYPGGSRSDRS